MRDARITAIYVRVSSSSQDLRSQVGDLERWATAAESEGHPIEWHRDKATGRTMDRPGWGWLWRDVLARRVGRIVVWRLDRLGRTAAELTALFRDLERLDVGLVSLRDGLDLATPAGRLMAHVLASVAQYETEVRSERQRAGIAAAQAAGQRFGRPKGTGRPIKLTPEVREWIRRLKDEGKSIAGIARLTHLSRTSVYAALHGVAASAET